MEDNIMARGTNRFVMLISRMNAGGDTDKVAWLEDPKVLLAMRKKYGLAHSVELLQSVPLLI